MTTSWLFHLSLLTSLVSFRSFDNSFQFGTCPPSMSWVRMTLYFGVPSFTVSTAFLTSFIGISCILDNSPRCSINGNLDNKLELTKVWFPSWQRDQASQELPFLIPDASLPWRLHYQRTRIPTTEGRGYLATQQSPVFHEQSKSWSKAAKMVSQWH